jgi:inorganic pyrophosphatase
LSTGRNRVDTLGAMNIVIARMLVLLCVPAVLAAQVSERPSNLLPEDATKALAASLEAARAHAKHIWRDTAPQSDHHVNAYIEIPRGERRKFEFNMRTNARAVDRVMPAEVGGYPVNYGFVPQTVSYDGDPFDALVLGPALPGGQVVQGLIVGLMMMEDEKGADSKVVLSPVRADGRPRYQLTAAEQERIAAYFRRYKRHEPGKFSRVPGWSSAEDGQAHITMTHTFFRRCRGEAGRPCRL